ncbi:MAG: PEP-CTERM sorting domain-containing protein [Verrucomicrobiota bacterium]|nr:PEP-CTERM sorting domain-containing protein [Verrucomicrobiota bacterium]
MKKLLFLGFPLLACTAQAVIIGDSDWNVSFSSGRFGPNHIADTGYNGWVPVSNDGGNEIAIGGKAIGSTSIANVNFDGSAGTSLRTFKKDNPFGPNPNAGWTIEEQFSVAEQTALGSMTQFDGAGKAAVSFSYMIKTGSAVMPHNGTTLALVAPTSIKYGLKFFDVDTQGNKLLSENKAITGLIADDAWHNVSFELVILSSAARAALDVGNSNNPDQSTLQQFEIIGDALTPYDVYIDNVQVSPVPEPSTIAGLAGVAALALAYLRRRKA